MIICQGRQVWYSVCEIRRLAKDRRVKGNATLRENAGGAIIGDVATERNDVSALIHFQIFALAIGNDCVLKEYLGVEHVGANRAAMTCGIKIFMERAA